MKPILDEIRIAFIFSSPEPIPEEILIENLVKRGFNKSEEIPQEIIPKKLGMKRADIAQKGDCRILYNNEKGIIGIIGKRVSEVLERFEEIETLLKEVEFGIDVETHELRVDSRTFVKNKKPLDSIARFLGEEKFVKFDKIIGYEIAPFSIRFYPKNKKETTKNIKQIPDWFDISIFPYVLNPHYFGVNFVVRNPEFTIMTDFLKRIEEIISQIIEVIIAE